MRRPKPRPTQEWTIEYWEPGDEGGQQMCNVDAFDEFDAVAQCLALYDVETISFIGTAEEYDRIQNIMSLEMLYDFSGYLERNGSERPTGNQD